MLEFIVLGQIPGTNFQITFAMIRSVLLLILVIWLIQLDVTLYHNGVTYKKLGRRRRNKILSYSTKDLSKSLKGLIVKVKKTAVHTYAAAKPIVKQASQIVAVGEKKLVLGASISIRWIRQLYLASSLKKY